MFSKLNLNLFLITLLVVTIIPLNLSYSSSSSYDLYLFLSLLFLTFILYIFFLIFLVPISFILKRFNVYQIWLSLISFVLFWIFLTGILFPITGDHDPFFNLSLSISKKYEIIIKSLLIIIFFFILKKKDKKNFFYRFIYIFICFNLFFIISNIKKDESNYVNKKLNHFGKKNLIVLSFDGISGYKLNEEILDNFELKKKLKDFKLYKNTITGAPYTFASMNIELNGKFEESDTNDFFRNILNQKNIDSSTYNYYQFITDKNKTSSKGEFLKYNNNFRVNKFIQEYFIGSVGRWASPLGVFALQILPHQNFYKSFLNLVFRNSSEDLNPFKEINTINHLDLFEFDMIFKNIKKDNDLENVVRMYHFSFSHWPVVVNESCNEVISLDKEIKSYNHEKIVLKCISKKIIKFINYLKDQDIYNNSMIVIKSDHAKPNYVERNYTQKFSDVFKKKSYSKFYKEYPLSQTINNSFYWGYGRYKPFILIKDENQIKENLEISNKQVFLHDLSKTYCEFFSIKRDCGYLKRNDLKKIDSNFDNHNYDIYLPVKRFTGTKINEMKKYKISSNTLFYDFFKINKIILSD